jgi:hypothetical protein
MGTVNREMVYLRRQGMRLLMVTVACVLIAGCGSSHQADQQEAPDSTLDDMNEALAACRRTYPDEITQAVARGACVNRAIAPLRPLLRFPDLLDQEIALRKSLAEQVQNNKVSLLDRLVQITELHKKMLAEEQSRVSANPSVPAQETVAAALWRGSNPASCANLGGNTQHCF